MNYPLTRIRNDLHLTFGCQKTTGVKLRLRKIQPERSLRSKCCQCKTECCNVHLILSCYKADGRGSLMMKRQGDKLSDLVPRALHYFKTKAELNGMITYVERASDIPELFLRVRGNERRNLLAGRKSS